MAKIELPESWASVAEPLRSLIAEVAREADGASPDLGTVSARWARVSEAIRAAVRTRIAHAHAAQVQATSDSSSADQKLPRIC